MHSQMNSRAHGLDSAPLGATRHPSRNFIDSSQEVPSAPTPGPNSDGTEDLLDLDGLLEIARLIEEIKKDGRLSSEDDSQGEHAGTRRGGD
jgi:hypothetical protein